MARLIVKNVGPIKDIDIELKKVNVFMGPQSCGKSTLAKIISFCSWLEKKKFMDADSDILPDLNNTIEVLKCLLSGKNIKIQDKHNNPAMTYKI